MSSTVDKHDSTTVDKRATNAIKICINRCLKIKSSVHLDIAHLISLYSHASVLQWGSVFEDQKCNFLIVQNINSPFWVRITHIPPIPYLLTSWGHICTPDWIRASDFHIKKVFDPFGSPYLKRRGHKYKLQNHPLIYSSLM